MSDIGSPPFIVAPGSIDTIHLADLAVEIAKINDLAVTAAKIAANAIETAKIDNNAVTGAKMFANAGEIRLIGPGTASAYYQCLSATNSWERCCPDFDDV